MPQFFIKEGRHFILYITGPSHVLLGVKFASRPMELTITRTSAQEICSHGHLDEAKIRQAVTDGLEAFRAEFGGELYAEEIIYVENDSPRYDMFKYTAYLLAKHFFNGGEFQPATQLRAQVG